MSKFIRIGIADKNDNPPYFDKSLYEAEVDENEDIQHTVLTVTANDKDECKYRNVKKFHFNLLFLWNIFVFSERDMKYFLLIYFLLNYCSFLYSSKSERQSSDQYPPSVPFVW